MNFSGIWILALKYQENQIWEWVTAYQKTSGHLLLSKCLGILFSWGSSFSSQFKLSSLFNFFSHISQGDWNWKCIFKLYYFLKSICFLPSPFENFLFLENHVQQKLSFSLFFFFLRQVKFSQFSFLASHCHFTVKQNSKKMIHLCKGCLLLNLIPLWTAASFSWRPIFVFN